MSVGGCFFDNQPKRSKICKFPKTITIEISDYLYFQGKLEIFKLSLMKTSQYTQLCAAALVGVLASCSSPSTTVTRVPVSSSLGREAMLSDQVFAEVNSYRSSKGKSALQRHAGLDRLAQQHCDYLAENGEKQSLHGKYVSHYGFEGRSDMARHQYRIMTLGENVVASSNRSPKHLLNLWSGSKGHEHNMRGDWTCTGVATSVNAQGMVVSTQLFGTAPSSSHGKMAGVSPRFSQQW